MIDKINRFVFSGHPRTVKAKKQIAFSFGLKGISIIVNLAYVPLLIDYLGKEEYGIWLTLTSIVTWFTFFDIGLGNGLRNNFTKAVAEGEYELARTYVSTTYAILTLIFGSLLIIFFIVAPFINWQTIFNTSTINEAELLNVSLIVFSFFFLRFVFQLIGVILLADQKPAVNNSFNVMANVISLFIIIVLKNTLPGSLPLLGFVLSGIPVLILFLASVYLYKTKYKRYAPSVKYVQFKESKKLLNLGVKFFILQISDVVMYSSTNMLIAQISSPEDVTVYNVSYKAFSIFTMIYGIILSPMWSATTEAFHLNDFKWIRKFVKSMQKIGSFLTIIIILFLLLSSKVYYLWVGDKVTVPFVVSLFVAINTIMYVLTGVYVSFQNGIGKIKLTLYAVIGQTALYLPIAYFISVVLGLGFVGVLVTGILMEVPVKIIQIAQYKKIINKTAVGIWNQ